MTGQRLDRYLSERHPDISRARWQEWIEAGQVRVNGQPVTKPAHRLRAGDTVDYTLPPDRPPDYDLTPEALPVPIVYEDDHLLVVNKPRGLTVHPAPGHPHGTLVNALLAHSPALAQGSAAFRPGVVHRLDKDTTGLLVVAKTDRAHARLSSALQRHAIEREYLALVWGAPREAQFTVDLPIGRHPVQRKKMAALDDAAILAGKARPARTHFAVQEAFRDCALLSARLETGRTHQVRVHASAVGHPVVGDALYGGVRKSPRDWSPELADAVACLQGQLLHAYALAFEHPITGEPMRFTASLPDDFQQVLTLLRTAGGIIKAMILDVSVPLRQPMPTYPGDAPFELIPVVRMAEGGVCNGSRLSLGTHAGTHIDAPWHFNDAGKRIHEIPLARLIGSCWVADLRGYPHITADALENAGIPPNATRLLLKTDNSALWGQTHEFNTAHVALTPDAAEWLIQRCVDVVGVDYLSIERYGATPEVHHLLCGAGKIIIEGLNLSAVDAGEYELLCMPLLIEGADGAPARVALRTLR